MAKGVKTGGRKPMTPNKSTQALIDRCEDLGVDPFHVLCLFAKGDWKGLGYDTESRVTFSGKNGDSFEEYITPQLRQKSAADLMDYIYPKRKAIEVELTPDERQKLDDLKAVEAMSREELLEICQKAAQTKPVSTES